MVIVLTIIILTDLIFWAAREFDESGFGPGSFPDEESDLRWEFSEDSEGRMVVFFGDDLVRHIDFYRFKISAIRYYGKGRGQLSQGL